MKQREEQDDADTCVDISVRKLLSDQRREHGSEALESFVRSGRRPARTYVKDYANQNVDPLEAKSIQSCHYRARSARTRRSGSLCTIVDGLHNIREADRKIGSQARKGRVEVMCDKRIVSMDSKPAPSWSRLSTRLTVCELATSGFVDYRFSSVHSV